MAPLSQPQTVHHESPRNNTTAPTIPSTRTSPLPSLLNPCANIEHQITRVYRLGTLRESCKVPINFYLAQDLLQTRKPHLISVRERLLPVQQQRRWRTSQSIELINPGTLEKEGEKKKHRVADMPSSCKDIRAALAQCLQESDCIMIHRNTPADCLRSPLLETMPTKCQQLKTGYGQCKRGMVDMRKRFRGNQPIALSKELDVASDAKVGEQLYAGKPAYGTGVKATSGNEPVQKDWRELENEKYSKD